LEVLILKALSTVFSGSAHSKGLGLTVGLNQGKVDGAPDCKTRP
jgi:hypothetical protein